MPFIKFGIFLFVLVARVVSQCGWSLVQDVLPAIIIDIKLKNPTYTDFSTSVPFTYVETFYPTSCNHTWTEWRTLYLPNNQFYTCYNLTGTVFSTETAVTFVFPDLIITSLEPGEIMTMVAQMGW